MSNEKTRAYQSMLILLLLFTTTSFSELPKLYRMAPTRADTSEILEMII